MARQSKARHRPPCALLLRVLLVMCFTHHQEQNGSNKRGDNSDTTLQFSSLACAGMCHHPHPHNVFVTFRGFPKKTEKEKEENQNKVLLGGS